MVLIPDLHVNRIWDISPALLHARDVRGLILDIDNTLTFDHAPDVPERTARWLDELKTAGIKAAIVSNNREARVRPFAEKCGLAYVSAALKPRRTGFERSCAALGEDAAHIAVIGDQLFTDILFGNRFGCMTILVDPMGPDILWFVKLKRILEKPFMRYIRKRKSEHAK